VEPADRMTKSFISSRQACTRAAANVSVICFLGSGPCGTPVFACCVTSQSGRADPAIMRLQRRTVVYETNRCGSALCYSHVLEPDEFRYSEGNDGHPGVGRIAESSPEELVMYCKAVVSPLLHVRVINVEKRAAIRYPLAGASRSPFTNTKHVREDHPYNLLSRRPWPAATDNS